MVLLPVTWVTPNL